MSASTKLLSSSPYAGSAIPDLVDGFGTTTIAPETAHAARIAVCARAKDAEDAAMLLAALGLDEEAS